MVALGCPWLPSVADRKRRKPRSYADALAGTKNGRGANGKFGMVSGTGHIYTLKIEGSRMGTPPGVAVEGSKIFATMILEP